MQVQTDISANAPSAQQTRQVQSEYNSPSKSGSVPAAQNEKNNTEPNEVVRQGSTQDAANSSQK